jgi:hypothetical protein
LHGASGDYDNQIRSRANDNGSTAKDSQTSPKKLPPSEPVGKVPRGNQQGSEGNGV